MAKRVKQQQAAQDTTQTEPMQIAETLSEDHPMAAAATKYTTLKTLFVAICDAIRSKTGGKAKINHQDIPQAILDITTGSDVSDATAVNADVRQGKVYYGAKGRATGTAETWQAPGNVLPKKTEQTFDTNGKFVEGNLTIQGAADLVPENIVRGKSIFDVAGTYDGIVLDPLENVVAAEEMLADKEAYDDEGNKLVGTLTDHRFDDNGQATPTNGFYPDKDIYFCKWTSNSTQKPVAYGLVYLPNQQQGYDPTKAYIAHDFYLKWSIENWAKELKVTPEVLKSGYELFGVTGTYAGEELQPLDNPATSADIANGKEVYGDDGQKITGEVLDYRSDGYTYQDANVASPGDGIRIGLSVPVHGTEQPVILAKDIRLYAKKTTFAAAEGLTADKLKKGEEAFGIVGTYEGSGGGGTDISDATALAAHVRSSYIFYGKNGRGVGTLPDYSGRTSVTPSKSGTTLQTAGNYMTQNITIEGDTSLVAGNIKSGETIFGVRGSYTGSGVDVSGLTAAANQVVEGEKFVGVDGTKQTGTMKKIDNCIIAPTFRNGESTSDAYIKTGSQYTYNDQDLRVYRDGYLKSSNIKSGITIYGVTGTYTGSGISGSYNAIDSDVKSGQTYYGKNGTSTGTMPHLSGSDFTATTVWQGDTDKFRVTRRINKAGYLNYGDSDYYEFSPTSFDSNLTPDNIKSGTTIFGVKGNYTGSGSSLPSGLTAIPNDVLYGKYFVGSDGTKQEGKIKTYSGPYTVTPTSSQQTLSTSGMYLNRDITVYAESGGDLPSGLTAKRYDVLRGKWFVGSDGTKQDGTIDTYSGSYNITPGSEQIRISTSGKYCTDDIFIQPVSGGSGGGGGTDLPTLTDSNTLVSFSTVNAHGVRYVSAHVMYNQNGKAILPSQGVDVTTSIPIYPNSDSTSQMTIFATEQSGKQIKLDKGCYLNADIVFDCTGISGGGSSGGGGSILNCKFAVTASASGSSQLQFTGTASCNNFMIIRTSGSNSVSSGKFLIDRLSYMGGAYMAIGNIGGSAVAKGVAVGYDTYMFSAGSSYSYTLSGSMTPSMWGPSGTTSDSMTMYFDGTYEIYGISSSGNIDCPHLAGGGGGSGPGGEIQM